MPARVNDQHAATGRETGQGGGGVPVPGVVAHHLGVSLGAVLERVVDDQHATAHTGDTAAYTRRAYAAASRCLPVLDRLVGQHGVGEQHLVLGILHRSLYGLRHLHGQGRAVAGQDDLHVRVLPQCPGRELPAGLLAFPVTRREGDHQPRTAAGDAVLKEPLQAPGEDLVGNGHGVLLVHPLHEGQEPPAAQHALGQDPLGRRRLVGLGEPVDHTDAAVAGHHVRGVGVRVVPQDPRAAGGLRILLASTLLALPFGLGRRGQLASLALVGLFGLASGSDATRQADAAGVPRREDSLGTGAAEPLGLGVALSLGLGLAGLGRRRALLAGLVELLLHLRGAGLRHRWRPRPRPCPSGSGSGCSW